MICSQKMSLMGATIACVCLSAAASSAAQFGDPDSVLSLEAHAFVSQGFIYSTNQVNYLAVSNRGSFEFTELGLNLTKALTDNLRFGLQLFAHDLGPIGRYRVKPDWYYLDYSYRDWLGVRAGRVKIPFGLYNDVSDIDSARASILLPQSVYPAVDRDILLAVTGVEAYGRVTGRAGALDYRAYGGTIFLDADSTSNSGSVSNSRVPYVVGARLMWETPLRGLTVGGTFQAVRLDADITLPTMPGTYIALTAPYEIYLLSVEYTRDALQLAAEYSLWRLRVITHPSLGLPPSLVQERAYLMLSYRFSSWLQPAVYYSLYTPTVGRQLTRADEQNDIAAAVRFDLNSFWLLKLEGHLMLGTASLDPTLNGGRATSTLPPVWGAFFAKTTVHF